MRFSAFGKAYGEIKKVSSISLSEPDFEGNDSLSKNVHEFLRTLTAVIESPPAGGLGETPH